MINYLSIAKDLTDNQPAARVTHGQVDGHNIWIKRNTSCRKRIWHNIQRVLANLLPYPILRPTVSTGGSDALKREADRLNKFAQMGIHAPRVLAVSDDLLVLNDIGPQLYGYLNNTKDINARRDVLVVASTALSRLHQHGMVHGRPYLRDMTWDGEKIGFLDLEEDPLSVMPVAAGQARDVWIFLSAVSRFSKNIGDKYSYNTYILDAVWDAYLQNAHLDTLKELANFVRLISPLIGLIKKYAWKKVGSDVRRATFVTEYLRDKLKNI